MEDRTKPGTLISSGFILTEYSSLVATADINKERFQFLLSVSRGREIHQRASGNILSGALKSYDNDSS